MISIFFLIKKVVLIILCIYRKYWGELITQNTEWGWFDYIYRYLECGAGSIMILTTIIRYQIKSILYIIIILFSQEDQAEGIHLSTSTSRHSHLKIMTHHSHLTSKEGRGRKQCILLVFCKILQTLLPASFIVYWCFMMPIEKLHHKKGKQCSIADKRQLYISNCSRKEVEKGKSNMHLNEKHEHFLHFFLVDEYTI